MSLIEMENPLMGTDNVNIVYNVLKNVKKNTNH